MATYSDRILKGDELLYYTKKIKDRIAQAEGNIQEEIDRLDGEVSRLDNKIDDTRRYLDELKLELSVEKEVVYKTEYVYDGVSYETEEEARQAAEEAGDQDPQISEVTVVDQILDEDGNPVDPEKNKLYLVPPTDSSSAEQPNVYNEYIYTDNGFELVGSTDINLEELTESDIDDIWNNAFSN